MDVPSDPNKMYVTAPELLLLCEGRALSSLCQKSRSLAVNSLSEFPQSGAVRRGNHTLTLRLQFLQHDPLRVSKHGEAHGIILTFVLLASWNISIPWKIISILVESGAPKTRLP